VGASCQDPPIIYAEGVVVRHVTHFVQIVPPYSGGVEQPGPFDLIIFVLPDEEMDYFFWSDSGIKLGPYRYVMQEEMCRRHGSGPLSDVVCGETTGGLYVTSAEILDSYVMASGLVALYAPQALINSGDSIDDPAMVTTRCDSIIGFREIS